MKLSFYTPAVAVLAVAAASCAPAAEETAAVEPAPAETAAATAAPADTDAEAVAAKVLAEVNTATYDVEKTHAFLFWSVSHGGLSQYVAKFTDWDATIDFDPSDVSKSKVTASINPTSVQTDHPAKADEWHAELANDFFKAADFARITFESTAIEKTGPMTGTMTGDLSFLGVTKPVTLDVTFNGVGNRPWFGDRDLIGFSAKGKFNRSDFGLEKMIAQGIGDETTIMIEAEFIEREAPAEDAGE